MKTVTFENHLVFSVNLEIGVTDHWGSTKVLSFIGVLFFARFPKKYSKRGPKVGPAGSLCYSLIQIMKFFSRKLKITTVKTPGNESVTRPAKIDYISEEGGGGEDGSE